MSCNFLPLVKTWQVNIERSVTQATLARSYPRREETGKRQTSRCGANDAALEDSGTGCRTNWTTKGHGAPTTWKCGERKSTKAVTIKAVIRDYDLSLWSSNNVKMWGKRSYDGDYYDRYDLAEPYPGEARQFMYRKREVRLPSSSNEVRMLPPDLAENAWERNNMRIWGWDVSKPPISDAAVSCCMLLP